MTREELKKTMERTFTECMNLRSEGQKEYAHNDSEAFANFIRVGERMKLSKEQVLMVYMEKHLDGIHSYIQGHKSQRENVRGRINDLITYAVILRGMIDEYEASEEAVPF